MKINLFHTSERKLIVAIVYALAFSAAAQAQTATTWQNTGSNFNTPANWSNGIGTGSAATLPSSLQLGIVNPSLTASTTITSLSIDNSGGGNYNLTQTGTNILTLSASGNALTVNGGTTTIDSQINTNPAGGSTLAINVLNNATLNLNGGIVNGAPGQASIRSLSVVGAGNVVINGLSMDPTTTSQDTFTLGTTVGSGFVGNVTISAGSPVTFTGPIIVNSGRLVFNATQTAVGTNQSFTVNSGTLGGTGIITKTGTLSAVTLNPSTITGVSGPEINPGDPSVNQGIGTLTIQGVLSLKPSSSVTGLQEPVLTFDLASVTSYDSLVVNSTLALSLTGGAGTGRVRLQLNDSTFSGGGVGTFLNLLNLTGSGGEVSGQFVNGLSLSGSTATTINNGDTLSFTGADGTYTGQYLYNNGGNNFGVQITNFVAAVPEPSTYAMMLGGLGVLVLMMRRSRNN